MKEVVVIDCIRTPMGRSKGGIFINVRAENLCAHLMTKLVERNPNVDPLISKILSGAVFSKPKSRVLTFLVSPSYELIFPAQWRRSPLTVYVVCPCKLCMMPSVVS